VRAYHVAIRELLPQTELTAWPQNGLRHSFASYHLAKHQDASKLALEMGHTSARLIFDAYREVVRPEEANRYWQIKPDKTGEPHADGGSGFKGQRSVARIDPRNRKRDVAER
jgi:hypothetical protein